jgi:hypothetical protein
VHRELGGPPVEHQAVHGAHETKTHGGSRAVVLMPGEQPSELASGLDLVGDPQQEAVVERRAELAAALGLST